MTAISSTCSILIDGTAPDPCRLHWNLEGETWRRDGTCWRDGGLTVTIAAEATATVREVRADPSSTLGWTSPTYGLKLPCTAVEIELTTPRAWFHTTFSTGEPAPRLGDEILARWRRGELDAAFSGAGLPAPSVPANGVGGRRPPG